MRSILALVALASLLPPAHGEEPAAFRQNPKEWRAQGGNDANWRYSPLTQITPENVGKLQPAWSFSTGSLLGHEGAPLVVGGVMYVHAPFPNDVYAIDLDHEGKLLWKYEPKQLPETFPTMCCGGVNRGLAYGDDKVFLSQADTTLVALDARTGSVVWSTKNGDIGRGETSTAAPAVHKDKVLVGISGGEFGVRGHITAYDIKSGKLLWRGYSAGPDAETLIDPDKTTQLGKPIGKEASLASWEGEQWKIGGGTVWGWFSYDPDLNLVYYGTGNPGPWNATQRPGDNRWTATIFARDLDTGAVRWVYQTTPHDEWDYDAIGEMILADLDIGGGSRRKALVHFDKNGFAYVLDRATGELLSAEKFDPSTNWASMIDLDKASPNYGRPIRDKKFLPDANGEDVNTKNICPSSLGAKGQQPAAYSPDVGLFLIPTARLCMDFESFLVSYTAGQPYAGASITYFTSGSNFSELLSIWSRKKETSELTVSGPNGAFIGWTANTGRIAWSKMGRRALASGALATAGGIAFYGDLDGYLMGVDIKSGKEHFRFKTASGIIGNVITYERAGKQYVAVLSGRPFREVQQFPSDVSNPFYIPYMSVGDTNRGGSLTVFKLPD